MIEDKIMTTEKDREKIKIMEQVIKKLITMNEAASILSISYRQVKRLKKAYISKGDAGLIHKSRGKPSNRKLPEDFTKGILELYKTRYIGFGPTLASEKLEKDGYKIDHETLRKLLIKEGLWELKRKREQHRERRERKRHFGEMVQIDGSHHKWFGDEHEMNCLFNLVDDATKTTLSQMDTGETTDIAMTTLWEWINKFGIPQSLYCDRKNVFVTDREPTVEEQLRNEEPLTFFGKACKKLGIRIIVANSPQAKGRVERNHAVYQDRFVKELKLLNIKDIDSANKLLKTSFVDELNNKFSIDPINDVDYHKDVPKDLDLRTVFCYEYDRKVSNDWVIQFEKRYFQITKKNKFLPRSGSKVIVSVWLDKSIHIYYNNVELNYEEITNMTTAFKKVS
jgi:transposase